MFRYTYELTDFFDAQVPQFEPDGIDKLSEASSFEHSTESAFLGPILWDDPLTLTDLDSINLDDFNGCVLTDALSRANPANVKNSAKSDRPPRRRTNIAAVPVELVSAPKSSAVTFKKKTTVPDELKNDVYWDRRRKNNESAKRSRDTRRMMETHVHMKAAELERENERLKSELARLKSENDTLRLLLVETPAHTNRGNPGRSLTMPPGQVPE